MKKIFLCVLLVLGTIIYSILGLTIESGAYAAAKKVVTVGYYYLPGFNDFDEEGNRVGFAVEYLTMLENYINWEFQFVDVADSEDAYNKVISGDIDIIGAVQFVEARNSTFAYSSSGIGTTFSALIAKEDDERFTYEDFAAFDGAVVATTSAFSRNSDFEIYARANGFNFTFKYYDTTEQIHQAINNGEADLYIANVLKREDDEKFVAKFAAAPLFFVSNLENAEMLNQFSEAVLNLRIDLPTFESDLQKKYYYNNQIVPFSKKELEYIANSNPIRIIVKDKFEPFFRVNDEGNYEGITFDYVNQIAAYSGLEVEFVVVDSYAGAVNALHSGDGDIFCGMAKTYDNDDNPDMIFSNIYYTSSLAIMTLNQKKFDLERQFTCATTKNFNTEYILKNFPNAIITQYDHISECADSVINGKSDALIHELNVVDFISRYPRYNNLEVLSSVGASVPLAFAFEPTVDAMLVSVINKSIRALPDSDFDKIIVQNTTGNNYPQNWQDFIAVYGVTLLFAAIILILIFTCLIVYILHRRKGYRILQEETNRYTFLINQAKNVFFDIDVNKKHIICSPIFREVFNREPPTTVDFTSDEKIAETVKKIGVPLDDARAIVDEIRALQNGNFMLNNTIRVLKFPDKYIWCSLTISATIKPEGIHIVGSLTDVDKEYRERISLEKKLMQDIMTGLLNKDSFVRLLNDNIADKHCINGALFFIDLDNFKSVNDTLGHLIGDKVLTQAAKKIRRIFRSNDIIGRFGGDEFFVFAPNIGNNLNLIKSKAKQICENVSDYYYSNEGDKSVYVSCSVGISLFPENGEDANTLINLADQAAYEVKNFGKNGYGFCALDEKNSQYVPNVANSKKSAADSD